MPKLNPMEKKSAPPQTCSERASGSAVKRSAGSVVKRSLDGTFVATSKEKPRSLYEMTKNLTPEEFRQSLLVAGIITKSGKLAKPYRS